MNEEIKEKSEYCLHCKIKPCTKGCPLGNSIPDFIECIKQGNEKQAYEVLCKTTVLSSICGRICPHMSQCQGSCVRGIKGEPVNIGSLEAYIGDLAIKNNWNMVDNINCSGKKVAIIGSGPAGLTCAANLRMLGHDVTIFEKYDNLGGILSHGIPNFRLDKEVLSKSIKRIIDLGIKVKKNQELGKDITLEQLQEQFDATFLAFGANISCKMNIKGEELNGVYGGNELLETEIHPNYIGKKVAIIGGGNVAMDTARSIKRLGAKEVYIIYRRAQKQMPAEQKEIEDAKKEGIEFLFQHNLLSIHGDNKVEKVELIKTDLVKKEGEGREVPINIDGSNYYMDMDYVVMAVGSQTQKDLVENLGLELTKYGYIKIDENYQTSKNSVFAGGDVSGTKATVAWASRSGREAAFEIDKFLNR